MIKGVKYYFFRLEREENDEFPEYVIAESLDSISLRFGESFVRCFSKITQCNEVTYDHILAVQQFLLHHIHPW